MTNKIDFSARGNAVGFTAKGEVITGRKMKCRGGKSDWAVEVGTHGFQLTNGLRQTFPAKADAIAYAASLIDAAKTQELAWWN